VSRGVRRNALVKASERHLRNCRADAASMSYVEIVSSLRVHAPIRHGAAETAPAVVISILSRSARLSTITSSAEATP
jgi:hypothetical protein